MVLMACKRMGEIDNAYRTACQSENPYIAQHPRTQAVLSATSRYSQHARCIPKKQLDAATLSNSKTESLGTEVTPFSPQTNLRG
jgi:hypothetical protein